MIDLDRMTYSIWDPTGNVTALVECPVAVAEQPACATALMRRHPEVEQVGFISVDTADLEPGVDVALRMAGGEFCGNASISAAACYLERTGQSGRSVSLRVSGAALPVEARLERVGEASYEAAILMPPAHKPQPVDLCFADTHALLPLVRMDGISHLVIEAASPFWHLLNDRAAAERAVRLWCEELDCAGLGLMFLGEPGSDGTRPMTPLVYVPAADTCFWESSCASGSAASGIYLADRLGKPMVSKLDEPGGMLCIECDPWACTTWLHGATRQIVVHPSIDHNL